MARTVLYTTRAPFLALVGPPEKIVDVDLLNDYTEFYVEFDKTRSISSARWALNSLSNSEQIYFFTTNRNCFVQLFEKRITENLSPEERSLRATELVSTLVMPTATPEERDAAHSAATTVIGDPREFVLRAWRRFVFADKYPENLDLFPFPFP